MTRKLVWNALFVLSAAIIGVYLSVRPWQVYREQRAIRDHAIAEMQAAEQSRASLTRQKASVGSSLGREQLARDAGYRRKGEVPVGEQP